MSEGNAFQSLVVITEKALSSKREERESKRKVNGKRDLLQRGNER